MRSLPDARLLDRVVRGRAWIPILGVMLVGIVAMQVEILKLSASTGRSLQQVTALQGRNQQLLASDAVLGDDQRIERLAFHMNMVMPGPTHVRFLDPRANAIGHALSSIHAPNATAFLAALPSAASTVAAASAGSTSTSPSNPTTSTGTTAPGTTGTPAGVAPTSAAPAVPTGPSTTTTGVPSPSSAAAPSPSSAAAPSPSSAAGPSPSSAAGPSPAPSSSAPPATATPNGAAAVPAAG